MTSIEFEDATKRLLYILKTEKSLLAAGQGREAVSLAKEKALAMEMLENLLNSEHFHLASAQQKQSLESVVQAARENARHFEAVRFGLQNVISRIERIGSESHTGAYNQYGHEVPFTGASGGYLKKV